jgi:hypothetical protein
MKFIRTDRGDYVSISAIERVEKEVRAKVEGKPDDGVRIFKFYNKADELLGSVRVPEERIDFLLAEFLPAQPGEKLITLHYDSEEKSVWHLEYRIIAWALEPGAFSPYPITTDGNVYSEPGIGILLEMPDGKLEEPENAIFDNLEAAKANFLKRHTKAA